MTCYSKLLARIRDIGKPFFIGREIFENQDVPWYFQKGCQFKDERWVRELRLAPEQKLRRNTKDYFNRCDRFSPDYAFAPDIFKEPLLSLYVARLSWEEYSFGRIAESG